MKKAPVRKTAKQKEEKNKIWVNRDSSRYGEDYHRIVKLTHSATASHCCFCYRNTGKNQAHHAMYRDEFGLVRDRELAGVHIFSLCLECHLLAHDNLPMVASDNWIIHPTDKSYNRNSEQFYQRLRYGFIELQSRNLIIGGY